MHGLMEWLPANTPTGNETSVVHGDFRLDNVVFHPKKPEIIAVLDWGVVYPWAIHWRTSAIFV